MDIQTLEQYSFRAWPALHEEMYDGWLLRFANGYTGRSNSVNPLYGSTADVDTKIRSCEAAYQGRGLLPRFKLTPSAHPANLDTRLEQRGYRRQSVSQVMTVDLARVPTPANPDTVQVNMEPALSEMWIQAFIRMSQVQPQYHETVRALLGLIEAQTCFASIMDDEGIVAVGLGVHDQPVVGVFDLVTDAEKRGRGYGTLLVTHLLGRALQNGATTGYLQVLAANAPALRLYTRLGFRTAYPYWYRVLSANGE